MSGTRPAAFRLWLLVIAGFVVVYVLGTKAPARTGPLLVVATAIPSFNNLTSSTEFGDFTWRGGIMLASAAEEFGGFSGLMLNRNCEDMVAVSDQGRWLKARLGYTDGLLTGISDTSLAPILDSKGRLQNDKRWADAEAITPLQDGRIGVAFERRVRFGAYDIAGKGFGAAYEAIPHPKPIDRGPENGEVEAFGQLSSGAFIAIAERQYDDQGNIRAWIWRDTQVTSFSIKRYDSYNVTDLAVMPDGSVMTVERSFTRMSLPGMLIRRFLPDAAKAGDVVTPDILLEASVPLYAIDNMEAIAVCKRGNETRVTLQSDNNFNTSVQSTLLLQFAYKTPSP